MPDFPESIGIALPVRSWSIYAQEAVESFISYARPVDRLLISFDEQKADDDGFIKNISSDSRVSIVFTPSRVSMAGHYEWCISQLHTEWITVLGQDDAIQFNFSTESTKAISYANACGVDAISFSRAYFNWPDGTSEMFGYSVKYSDRGLPRLTNSKIQLLGGLAGLVEHYDFPQIYANNLVRRSVVEKMRFTQGGRVFLEPIPDTYSGVAVALALGSYLRWPAPIFWTGTSHASAGLEISRSKQVPPHIQLANEEGRFFGVSQEFWAESNNSSVFVLSAISTLAARTGKANSETFIRLMASASLFASHWITKVFSPKAVTLGSNWTMNPLTNTRMSRLMLSVVSGFGLCLIPLQLLARGRRKIRLATGTSKKTGLYISSDALANSPSQVNLILRQRCEGSSTT